MYCVCDFVFLLGIYYVVLVVNSQGSINDQQGPVNSISVCEGQGSLEIVCEPDRSIQVASALYGRLEQSICPRTNIHVTDCAAATALQVVQDECNGKHSCALDASNSFFGEDPCPEIPKYLKVDYYCTRVCNDGGPLGMTDGTILNEQITASSEFEDYQAWRARLFKDGSWATAEAAPSSPWIQVIFKDTVFLTGIWTQGDDYTDRGIQYYNWVKTLQVQYGNEDVDLTYIMDGQRPMTFTASNNNIDIQTIEFPKTITARVLRIRPKTWNNWCILRMEIIGCRLEDECSQGDPCHQNADCYDLVDGYQCVCQPGYEGNGLNCADVDECFSDPCNIGGSCDDVINGYSCTCHDGWTGQHCEIEVNECESSPCKNNSTCSEGVNSFNCTCYAGFTGMTCNEDVNECQDQQAACHPMATCSNSAGSYQCACKEGFKGDGYTTCEELKGTTTTTVPTNLSTLSLANNNDQLQEDGNAVAAITGCVLGAFFLVICLVVIIVWLNIRRKRDKTSTSLKLEIAAPLYEITANEITTSGNLPDVIDSRNTYSNEAFDSNSEGIQNNDIYQNIPHQSENYSYAYADDTDAPEMAAEDDDPSSPIYAEAKNKNPVSSIVYGKGWLKNKINSSKEPKHTEKADSSSPIYTEAENETAVIASEGWSDNKIYSSSNSEAEDENEGWRDNSLYDIA